MLKLKLVRLGSIVHMNMDDEIRLHIESVLLLEVEDTTYEYIDDRIFDLHTRIVNETKSRIRNRVIRIST